MVEALRGAERAKLVECEVEVHQVAEGPAFGAPFRVG